MVYAANACLVQQGTHRQFATITRTSGPTCCCNGVPYTAIQRHLGMQGAGAAMGRTPLPGVQSPPANGWSQNSHLRHAGQGCSNGQHTTLIKKNIKFSTYIREIQKGAVAKSYMRKGCLIHIWGNAQIFSLNVWMSLYVLVCVRKIYFIFYRCTSWRSLWTCWIHQKSCLPRLMEWSNSWRPGTRCWDSDSGGWMQRSWRQLSWSSRSWRGPTVLGPLASTWWGSQTQTVEPGDGSGLVSLSVISSIQCT